MMLKLGYNEATCKENSTLENDLRLCEKYNYDFIELRLDMLTEYLKNHVMQDLKDFFSKSHIKPFSLNSIENINFCTPRKWEELLKLFTFACNAARELNIPYIILVPTVTDNVCTKTEKEVFEDSVRVLRKLDDIARPCGIRLSFEPIGDRRWCCRSLRQALEIVTAVNRPGVGLTVDCINLYMHDKCTDLGFIRQVPADKLFVYHINDCEDLPLGVLDHCHRIMPGEGIIPIAEITGAVKAAGYDGPACLELFRPQYWEQDAEQIVKRGAGAVRQFL